MNNTTNEILFGGGAGGGKTRLGVEFLIYSCGVVPGIRNLMGRSKLKNLKQTTLNTFFEVCSQWGIKLDVHFKYNSQDGIITFNNGSEIILKDLFTYPSDPNFDSLGSLEITHAFIDEANQVSVKAKAIVASRQRYKVKEFGITPKLLMSCNPAKNWTYADFYKPWKAGTLPAHKQFVQALAKDNPYLPKNYMDQLQRLDTNSRERLMNGNWEYDDDPTKMFDFHVIQDLFTTNTIKPARQYERYLSVDVARHGSDKTVIGRWQGLQLEQIITIARSSTTETSEVIKTLSTQHNIGRSHIIVDEDGIGGGVVDQLPGCVGFLNGGKVINLSEYKIKNYANLKTQCYFKLAEKANAREIGIFCTPEQRDAIVEELEQIKEKSIDIENKVAIISKEEIRESLGRSPDFADMMMMRMYFELNNPGSLAKSNEISYNAFNYQENQQTIFGDVMNEEF